MTNTARFARPNGDLETKMTCREFADSIPRYVEDELTPEERRVCEAHAEGCADCASYLASYLHTIRLAREALTDPEEERADLEVMPDLLRAVLQARKPPEG